MQTTCCGLRPEKRLRQKPEPPFNCCREAQRRGTPRWWEVHQVRRGSEPSTSPPRHTNEPLASTLLALSSGTVWPAIKVEVFPIILLYTVVSGNINFA